MNEPIRRSDYPDTRDEQAMRRFMAGTLNVGHNLTFQRKGSIVNVSPQSAEREVLSRFYEDKGIHKNDRCVNARLIMFTTPVRPEQRLSREVEYDIYPFTHAQISLTPAEPLSELGKKRNMHMQTHSDLPNAPTVIVYGVGLRKGEKAMLAFVKDTINFKTDLERDQLDTAARQNRPFITPWPADTAEQMLNLPAHPTAHIRDLFEPPPGSTPSDVASQAQRAVQHLQLQQQQQAALQLGRPSFHGEHQQQHVTPGSVLLNTPQGGSSAGTFGRYQAALLTSQYQPAMMRGVPQGSIPAMPGLTPPRSGSDSTSQLEAVVMAGMAAAKVIFPLQVNSSTSQTSAAAASLPEARFFLDLERCRMALRNMTIPAHEMFATWQANQARARQASWNEADDSGVVMQERDGNETGEKAAVSTPHRVRQTTSGSNLDHASGPSAQASISANAAPALNYPFAELAWDQSAWDTISPERAQQAGRQSATPLIERNAAHPSTAASNSQASESSDERLQAARNKAASALLALSPAKRGQASRT